MDKFWSLIFGIYLSFVFCYLVLYFKICLTL